LSLSIGFANPNTMKTLTSWPRLATWIDTYRHVNNPPHQHKVCLRLDGLMVLCIM
jgi:hypothetical protein